MIASIWLLKNLEKRKDFSLYIFIVGCIANFVDFFTVPLITLGIPLLIQILQMQKENKNWKECLRFILKNSLLWLIGYAFTWFSKWLLYDLLFGEQIIQVSIHQALHRIKREVYIEKCSLSEIIGVIFYRNILYVAIFTTVWAISQRGNVNFVKSKEIVPFLLIACMPLLWYIVLGNHTILHIHFVYRHMILFVCGVLLGIQKILKVREKYDFQNGK